MAHFFAELKGQAQSTAHRIGSKKSGAWAHVRGWRIGGRVECYHHNGHDYVVFFVTHGTFAPGNAQCLGCFRLAKDGTFEPVE